MKRVLVVVGLLLLAASVAGAQARTHQGYPVVNVELDGQAVISAVPGINFNGTTLLPLRAIAEALGLEIAWDGAASTARLKSRALAAVPPPAVDTSRVAALEAENQRLKATIVVLEAQMKALEGQPSTASSDQGRWPITVESVVDGDTIKVMWNGKLESVRLIGVDTPETVHPTVGVEPYGIAASNFTKTQLTGETVELEFDVEERDRYGRLLSYVWLADGSMFNETLIVEGYGQVSTFPPNVRYVERFRAAQTEAREANRGLWGAEPEDDQVETAEQNLAAPDESSTTDAVNCVGKIKGNISSSGEKIYHVSGGAFYDRTDPEEWFCTETEAQQAGYRRSLR